MYVFNVLVFLRSLQFRYLLLILDFTELGEKKLFEKKFQAYLINFSKHIIPECPLVTLKFKLQLRRSLGIFQHSEPRVNPRDLISKEHRNNEQRLSFWRRRFQIALCHRALCPLLPKTIQKLDLYFPSRLSKTFIISSIT